MGYPVIFYGVVAYVGGLVFTGYLGPASELMYSQWGDTNANIAVGFLSAIVDDIRVMFAVLTMLPYMTHGQWLMVILTAGVGGSLLSIGPARGDDSFFGHLKWTLVIA
jgi:Na+/H+ antiporter NhaD/arsenite permease-like protein